MNIPAADRPRIAAALAPVAVDVCAEEADYSAAIAYIATAEGTAEVMAERACDRAGLDFAACPVEILDAAAKRAEELAAPVAVTPAEVDAFLIAVHRNQFATSGACPELRRAAAAKVRASIDINEKRPSYRGKTEERRQLWRRYHWINPDNR